MSASSSALFDRARAFRERLAAQASVPSPAPTPSPSLAPTLSPPPALPNPLTAPPGLPTPPTHSAQHLASLESQLIDARSSLAQSESQLLVLGTEKASWEEERRTLERRVDQLVNQLRAGEAVVEKLRGKEGKPRTFERLSEREALDVLKVSREASDKDVLSIYDSLLSSANASNASTLHGALYTLSITRPTPSLFPALQNLLEAELTAYLTSLDLPPTPFLQHYLNPPQFDASEKARMERMESQLESARKEVEKTRGEVGIWRGKAKSAKLGAGPTRKVGVLLEDLEKVKGEKREAERREKEERMRAEKAEKEGARERDKVVEMEEMLALSQPGTALSTTGTSAGPAANNSKFVIARLAETVTTLSAELAAKTAENADLMLGLVGRGEEQWSSLPRSTERAEHA